ncbi:hypothetical protein HZB02_06895 [Candidatus Woesearchaeota archaeon]|nr:hypothetical protein [Candidatus Woesearchaeota archaeon]
MAERQYVINYEELKYEGIFNARELYDVIERWCRNKNFVDVEKRNFEQRFPSGKQVEIEITPYRKTTDYLRLQLKIEIFMRRLKDVKVKVDGKEVAMNKGEFTIFFHGFLDYDYWHKWEKRGIFVFIRALFDQIVYREMSEQYRLSVIEDVNELRDYIKKYLNMCRSSYPNEKIIGATNQNVVEKFGISPQINDTFIG